jgi:hypothetical protein
LSAHRDEDVGFNQMASWSPDGKKLAFLSTRAGYTSVFVMAIDERNEINLRPNLTMLGSLLVSCCRVNSRSRAKAASVEATESCPRLRAAVC